MHLLVAIGYDHGYKNNGSCSTHHSVDQTTEPVIVNFLLVKMWCFCVLILIQLSRIACMDPSLKGKEKATSETAVEYQELQLMFKNLPEEILSILKLESNINWGKSALKSKIEVLLSYPTANTNETLNENKRGVFDFLVRNKDKQKGEDSQDTLAFLVDDTFLDHQIQKQFASILDNMAKTVNFRAEDRLSVLSMLVCSYLKKSTTDDSDVKFFKNLPEIQSELDELLHEYSLPPRGISQLWVLTSLLFSD
jgi:hypothetical protein